MINSRGIFRICIVFVFLIILLNPTTTTAEDLDYARYKNNTTEFCHGIHVGDKFNYEEIVFSQFFWENGSITFDSNFSSRSQFSLGVIEIRANTATSISSYSFWWLYKFNYTSNRQELHTSEISGTFTPTESVQEYDYFLFTDWDAWINTYGNISVKEVNRGSYESESYDNYIVLVNSDFFVRHIMNDKLGRVFHETLKYNITDGTLVSSFRTYHYYEIDRYQTIVSIKTDLINKEKVSEEITCLDIKTTEKSNSDDSALLGFLYPILLIPIIRKYKSQSR